MEKDCVENLSPSLLQAVSIILHAWFINKFFLFSFNVYVVFLLFKYLKCLIDFDQGTHGLSKLKHQSLNFYCFWDLGDY